MIFPVVHNKMWLIIKCAYVCILTGSWMSRSTLNK